MDRRTRERVQALTGLHVLTVDHRLRYLGLTSKLGGRPPPMYDGSIPSIGVKAATAAGSLPYPSRTRKISPPAFRPVLECANLWETRFAASHSYYPHTAVAVWGFFRSAASRTATLNPPQRLGATAPRWQSPAQRIRLQSGTPAGSNPALGSHISTATPHVLLVSGRSPDAPSWFSRVRSASSSNPRGHRRRRVRISIASPDSATAVQRREAVRPSHTPGCTSFKILATPMWRESRYSYSHQYQNPPGAAPPIQTGQVHNAS